MRLGRARHGVAHVHGGLRRRRVHGVNLLEQTFDARFARRELFLELVFELTLFIERFVQARAFGREVLRATLQRRDFRVLLSRGQGETTRLLIRVFLRSLESSQLDFQLVDHDAALL